MTPQLKDGLPLLVDVDGILLPAVHSDCCCDCAETTCHDDYGGKKIIRQVVFSVVLPNVWDVWVVTLDSGTGERNGYRRTRYTGFSVFDGSYTANRADYPDCSWTFPSVTESISWETRSWFGTWCPSGDGSFHSSGSGDISVVFPTGGLGAPLNHRINFGTVIAYSPDVHYPCNTSSLIAIEQGNEGCIAETEHFATATSYE